MTRTLRILILLALLTTTLPAKATLNYDDYERFYTALIEHHSNIVSRSSLTGRELQCLARNIYYEARGEPILGWIAVINVTINRSQNNNTTICSTVNAPGQFSWTSRPQRLPGGEIWQRVQIMAWLAIHYPELVIDITNGSTYFHSCRCTPAVHRRFQFVRSIGNHRFYRDPRNTTIEFNEYDEIAEAR